MNLATASIQDLLSTAFFFGMAAGLLVAYLMVALVWRMTVTLRVSAAAERIAENAQRTAEMQLVEARLQTGRADLRELFDQAKVIRASGSGVTH
jgi:hypothetical protein